MRRNLATLVLWTCAIPVFAQPVGSPTPAAPQGPKAEVYVGYQEQWDLGQVSDRDLRPPGPRNRLHVSIDWDLSDRLALAFDPSFAIYSGDRVGSGLQLSILGGPRYRFGARGARLSPFAQVLVGVAHGMVTVRPGLQPVPGSRTAFQISPGGGLDVVLNDRLAVRIIQVEQRMVFGASARDASLAVSAGVVMRFGTRPR